MCDFGHAVRLYVDPRSTGGTEKYGEKEVKRRRHEKKRKREREKRERGAERDREDSIYSAFVPSSSRERESPSTRLDSNSLVTTTGETDRGGKETEPERVRGKRRDNEGERKKDITRERKRERGDRSEATQEGRIYAEEAENSLFEERPSSNRIQDSVYAGRHRKRDEEKGKGEKERKTHSPGSPCVR